MQEDDSVQAPRIAHARRPSGGGSAMGRELGPSRRQALRWVTRLSSGRATRADAEALQHWRSENADQAAALAEVSDLWKNLAIAGQTLRASGAVSPNLTRAPIFKRPEGRRLFLGVGLATVAGSWALVSPPLHLWPAWNELRADYRTRTGELRDITLTGDVAVRLDARSSLAVGPSSRAADSVRLVSGQASFTTAPKGQGTLFVQAGNGRIVAHDARFDVCQLDSDGGPWVRVTCLEGTVRVEHNAETAEIGQTQQVRYDESRIGPVVSVDLATASAWQSGVLIFHFTPLAEVVAEVNRYRPGRVILLNEALGRVPVSGRFRADHVDDVLPRLEQAFGAKLRRLPGGIVLLT